MSHLAVRDARKSASQFDTPPPDVIGLTSLLMIFFIFTPVFDDPMIGQIFYDETKAETRDMYVCSSDIHLFIWLLSVHLFTCSPVHIIDM